MKYYRFTNERECHNGFQFEDGINEDCWPFCEDFSKRGGFCFISRDQFATYPNNYSIVTGPTVWIREVTLVDGAQLVCGNGKMKTDKFILGPRRRITLDLLCEEFEIDQVDAAFKYLILSEDALGDWGDKLTSTEFMRCAQLYNFPMSLCDNIIGLYRCYWSGEEKTVAEDFVSQRASENENKL